jgi:FkbM family methyltransferase
MNIARVANRAIHPRRFQRETALLRQGIVPRDYYEWNIPWLTKQEFDLILDIGAARGSLAKTFHALFPDAIIHAFEPIPQSYRTLSSVTQRIPSIVLHNVALADKEGIMKFHLGGQGFLDSSSLLPMAAHARLWPGSDGGGSVEVPVVRLDSKIQLDGSERILVKMDVQGAEAMVVAGGRDIFAAAQVVVAEVSFIPLYEGGPLFSDIFDLMRSLGFEFRGLLDQLRCGNGTGMVVQGDAVFCKPVISS